MSSETKIKETDIGLIPEHWSVKKIGKCVDLLTGYPFESKNYSEEGIRVLRGENVSLGFLRWDTDKRWNNGTKDLKKYFLEPSDVVIGMDGSRIGRNRAMVKEKDLPLLLAQRVARLRSRSKDELDQNFLKYIILSNRFYNYVESIKTGTSIPHISGKQISDFLFALPTLEEQKLIANILTSLDDKIELNHQINQTLEAMAQAIFKSWFVDFEPVKAKIAAIEAGEDAEDVTRAAMRAISGKTDEELDQLQAEKPENYTQLKTTAELFPSSMQDSELGEIPEGWESKVFSKVIDVNPARRLPKGKLATKVSMADLDTWQSWIDSWQKEEYKSGPKFKNGDTIFARITPSLENGKTAFVNFLSTGETAYGSTEFIVFGPKIIASGSYIFCLSRSEHIRETAINAMTGTSGRQRVPNGCFDHLLICVPPDKIVGKFNEITMSLFRMIEHNSKESINLKEARDTLLPKLLSGELSVDAAKLAEE